MRACLALAIVAAACGADESVPSGDAARSDAGTRDGTGADGPSADARADAGAADDARPDALPDAPAFDAAPDADLADITVVACASAPIAVTVTTSTADFSPAFFTIAAGEVSGTYGDPDPYYAIIGNEVGCVRFGEPGTFPYFCSVHPLMDGAVTVIP